MVGRPFRTGDSIALSSHSTVSFHEHGHDLLRTRRVKREKEKSHRSATHIAIASPEVKSPNSKKFSAGNKPFCYAMVHGILRQKS